MRLSDLQDKDIINVQDGSKIGNIIDVFIEKDGSMRALIIQKNKLFSRVFSSKEEIEIKWEQIKKIGEDVILVSVANY